MYQELRFAVLALAVAMSTAQAQEQEGKFIIGPPERLSNSDSVCGSHALGVS